MFRCRPPRGGRGLKFCKNTGAELNIGRPPRGGRGLKCPVGYDLLQRPASPSSRRAWIEIKEIEPWEKALHVALLAEGVD